MLMFNFNTLVLLAVFIGFSPIESSAQTAIVAPAPKAQALKVEPLTIKKQSGEDITITPELAIKTIEQAKGLMFRTEMPEKTGMLFVFQDEAPRSFWMRNTLIPLDMIFIKRNGEILNIHEGAIPLDETPIHSKGSAYAVLELNSGEAKKLGLAPGDKLIHEYFGFMPPKVH